MENVTVIYYISGTSDFATTGIDEAGGNYYAALHEIGHAIYPTPLIAVLLVELV